VFPESTVFRQAWEKGEIDEKILLKLLEKTTVRISEYYLQQMASHKSDVKNSHHDLDRIMAKWLRLYG
jgi:hypothetical protein